MCSLLKTYFILHPHFITNTSSPRSKKYSISLAGAGTRGRNHMCITFSGYCTNTICILMLVKSRIQFNTCGLCKVHVVDHIFNLLPPKNLMTTPFTVFCRQQPQHNHSVAVGSPTSVSCGKSYQSL